MDKLSMIFILFAILLILVFFVDYVFIKRRYLNKINGKKKNKKKSNNELTELSYLIGKFKLDKDKLPLNILLLIISLINAFIIALVAVVVMLININIIFQLLIGFILLIALIYSIYELLGNYLVKKGYVK